ncbi:unnamed protein product [Ambrosiozyma monospora]|uniref:Unnamed protein product n=1 Tax=Ambrosiozyma monospora TaxID=43982 RepID=A0A9W6TAJ3_AMBMO|nr:unnamed protein product [Ambrosiozyma monospora]
MGEYHFNVKMACSGCSNAVNKCLTNLSGVKNVDIDLDKQSVDVTTDSSLSYDDVYNTIVKSGKAVHSGMTIVS